MIATKKQRVLVSDHYFLIFQLTIKNTWKSNANLERR